MFEDFQFPHSISFVMYQIYVSTIFFCHDLAKITTRPFVYFASAEAKIAGGITRETIMAQPNNNNRPGPLSSSKSSPESPHYYHN